jgi:peroxiredoxin Q/BCP
MLKEGQKAPAFELESSDGGKVKLADFAGKTLVVYFYPRDATPGCTREAQGFRDAAKELQKRGAAVVGISRDSIASHQKFCTAQKLDFPLLSDPKSEVHEKYGAWGEKTSYGKTTTGVIRTTVVIGPDGKVKKVFPNVKVDGHVDKVIAAIDAK